MARAALNFLLENSLFLILGTLAALVMANVDPHLYHEIVHGGFHFAVNDVLMTLFFAIAAKEIWEALLPGGALNDPKKAATPLLSTLGGVVGPALLFILGVHFFDAPELSNGWAIPTATDIAFGAMVARLAFGKKHPAVVFLLLLAIADDAIGLIILAIAYPTGDIRMDLFIPFVLGAIILNLIMKRAGVKSFWAYLLIAGPLSWYGFYAGGIHPALALVPIIPILPHGKKHDEEPFEDMGPNYHHNALDAFEHWWKNPVEIILMLFGFTNAGVEFGSMGLATGLVAVALLVGKPLGIFVMGSIGRMFGLKLPEHTGGKELLLLGVAAGVGFTVALFVSGVAFPAGDVLDSAKMGALFSFAAFPITLILSKILGIKRIN